jgi:hypothetical protein
MRSEAWLLVFGALLAAAACRHETAPPAAKADPSSAVATSVARPPLPATSTSVRPAAAAEPAEVAVVRAWDAALDKHDLDALDRLYAERVVFYGRPLTKAAVIQAKRAAFAKQSSYSQQIIGEIKLERADDGRVSASFLKRTGDAGKSRTVSAKLLLALGPQGYRVAEETDEASAARAQPDCEAKTHEIVEALPQVRRATSDAMKEADQSDGGLTFGGVGPSDDDEGGFVVSTGLHSDERFDARIVTSVNRSGALTVTVLGEDVPVPPAALEAVRRACAH